MPLAPVKSIEATTPMPRGKIVQWWEIRRIPYNVQVGLAGVISLTLVIFVGALAVRSGDDFEEPMGLIALPIAFGIVANLCYTCGWMIDIIFYRGRPRRMLFRVGLVFSIVLALLPGLWAVAAWLFTVYTGKSWTSQGIDWPHEEIAALAELPF
jgi:hypothetical protein